MSLNFTKTFSFKINEIKFLPIIQIWTSKYPRHFYCKTNITNLYREKTHISKDDSIQTNKDEQIRRTNEY